MMKFYNIKFKYNNKNIKSLLTRNFNNYSDSIAFKYAVKIYNNPLNQRNLIRKDNKDKVGIYSWINKINGKFYIGRSDSLYVRISDYYQNWYILYHSNVNIVKTLSKYGMKNFSLVILEYSNSENLVLCEQKWINFLKPEYNIRSAIENTKYLKYTMKIKKNCAKFI